MLNTAMARSVRLPFDQLRDTGNDSNKEDKRKISQVDSENTVGSEYFRLEQVVHRHSDQQDKGHCYSEAE